MGVAVWAWVVAIGVCVCVGAVCVPPGEGEVYIQRGDVIITQLLPLYTGPDCTMVGLREVQVVEATKMAVERVNQLGLIPGVTMGVRVVDTCGADMRRVVKMALMTLLADTQDCLSPTTTLAFLGPSEVEAASALGLASHELHTPVVSSSPRPTPAHHTLDLVTPAPHRAAKALVRVLAGAGVHALSVVHTADVEGREMAAAVVEAAEEGYRCVEAVVEEAGGLVATGRRLEGGPGSVVVVGSRHGVLRLARYLGSSRGPADLVVLVDSAGPVPQAELMGVVAPVLILQRSATTIPEFQSFFQRSLDPSDTTRRHYLAAVSDCATCDLDFGYDPGVLSVVGAVLTLASALREATQTLCSNGPALCPALKALSHDDWTQLIKGASLVHLSRAAFPSLDPSHLHHWEEDNPRYSVRLLNTVNTTTLTQVGHADEVSAVLGELGLNPYNCGSRCPCKPPLRQNPGGPLHPAPGEVETPLVPTKEGGMAIQGGGRWWREVSWLPTDWSDPSGMTNTEIGAYITAFLFLALLFMASSAFCIYSLNKPPSRSE